MILDVKLSQYSTTIDEEIYKTKKQSSINCLLNKISEFENSKKYVSYSINESELNNKKSVLLKEYTEQSEILSDQFDKGNIIRLIGYMDDYEKIVEESMKIKSLYARKYYVDSYKEKLQNLTSEKSKRYFQYVFNYDKWQNDRKMIIGDIPIKSTAKSLTMLQINYHQN